MTCNGWKLQQQDLANAHARQADDEKHAALYQAYRASLAAASAALENHDVADASRHLKLAPEDLRGWEWRHLRSRLDDSAAVTSLPAAGSSSLVATPGRFRVAASTSSGVRLTDLESGASELLPIRAVAGMQPITANQTSRGLRIAALKT